MEFKEQKPIATKPVDNSAFNDRFKFIFSVNNNIICERFFKINGFDYDAINSEKMKNLFVGDGDMQYGTVINMIVNDLKSKSRIYTWYTTETPVKLTGFGVSSEEATYIVYPKMENVESAEPDKNAEFEDGEPEIVEPFDVTFKFSFQMAQRSSTGKDGKPVFSNYKPIYEAIWDGSVYPKFVRNSVDMTNLLAVKDKEPSVMNFVQSLSYRMSYGKKDLTYYIIREIIDAATLDGVEAGEPKRTRKRKSSYLVYGDKKYPMCDLDFNKEYLDGWRKAVEQKTKDYYRGRV